MDLFTYLQNYEPQELVRFSNHVSVLTAKGDFQNDKSI